MRSPVSLAEHVGDLARNVVIRQDPGAHGETHRERINTLVTDMILPLTRHGESWA